MQYEVKDSICKYNFVYLDSAILFYNYMTELLSAWPWGEEFNEESFSWFSCGKSVNLQILSY